MSVASKSPVQDKLVLLGYSMFPTYAFFELTHKCNGSCGYCYIGDKSESTDLDTKSVLTALDKLADAGILNVVFSGGEIFIRPDILDILQYAIRKDFFHIGLMTNGTLLTMQHKDFIIENKSFFDNVVSMTVFSHIPEVNDSYFGIPGALSRIIANGEYLIKGGVAVGLKLNVMEFNIATFIQTCDVLSKRGFSVVHCVGTLCSPFVPASIYKKYNEANFLKEYLGRLPETDRVARKNDFVKKIAEAGRNDFCTGRFTGICVGNDGTIKPCVGFRELSSCNILSHGTLREIILKSESLLRVRKISQSDFPKCRACPYSSYWKPCLAEFSAELQALSAPPTKACKWVQALREVNSIA